MAGGCDGIPVRLRLRRGFRLVNQSWDYDTQSAGINRKV